MTSPDIQLNALCPNCGAKVPLCGDEEKCGACGVTVYLPGVGFLLSDLEGKAEERQFYDETYDRKEENARKRSLGDADSEWVRPDQPQNGLVRDYLGNVSGKIVLMLGNGASRKELSFLAERPAKLIYSDLSINASRRLREEYDLTDQRDRLITASIDAEAIPLESESVDVVYAYAMVHHLPNLQAFFVEACRVLKPGGKAVFMDDAYSRPWVWAKLGVLRKLMRRSHRKSGISPEDYRFSMTGGFKEEELSIAITSVGCQPFFERTAFLNYIICRGAEKCLPKTLSSMICTGAPARFANAVDRLLSNFGWYRRWQIRLVWGFHKP